MPIGNKIKQNINIPDWINQRKSWQLACLRGLFDTDGRTYIDHHFYKDKRYGSMGVAFTSYSADLLQSINTILKNLGYSPTISTKWRVLLRRDRDIFKFFQECKPKSKRHSKKLKEFLEEYRSGRNGPASKAAVVVRLP